jgi:hypothetical protein
LKTSLCRQRERERERSLSPFVFVTGKKFISFFVLEGESNGERGVSVQYTAPVEVHTPWDRRYVFLALTDCVDRRILLEELLNHSRHTGDRRLYNRCFWKPRCGERSETFFLKAGKKSSASVQEGDHKGERRAWHTTAHTTAVEVQPWDTESMTFLLDRLC